MKRILMHLPDMEGSGLHRAVLPLTHCREQLAQDEISLTGDYLLRSFDYDAYVVHRCPRPPMPEMLARIKDKGKKIIWDLDDDYWRVPTWNPAHKYQDMKTLDWLRENADRILVSTEPLAQAVNRPEKTTILPNLVDRSSWPRVERKPNDPLRILWAGSIHHAKDIEEVVPAVIRLIEEYRQRVLFLFWGDLPDALSEIVHVRYSHLTMQVPADLYRGCLGLIQSVPTPQYPETAVTIQPDIGLAPLSDDNFNHSKSNLKYLDYAMMGCPGIYTDQPPYSCVKHGETGLLVPPGDSEGWYEAVKTLIEDDVKRDGMGFLASIDVQENWTWDGPKKWDWINAFRSIAWA